MVEDARSPHLKYTRLHFMWRIALVYLSFFFVRHTSSSNIPGLAQIARIDRPCIYRMTKSIQKSVGGYDFGGIKWQYGFSMAGADAGVRFRSPLLLPSSTDNWAPSPLLFRSEMSSSAFSFPSELLSSFPAASDDVMTHEWRILRFWHVEYVIHKNGNCVWTECQIRICGDMKTRITEWLRRLEKKVCVDSNIKSLTLCVLIALVGPQLTIYIGPKASSSRTKTSTSDRRFSKRW